MSAGRTSCPSTNRALALRRITLAACFVVLVATSRPSEACRCRDYPAAQLIKKAEAIYLARATSSRSQDGTLQREFSVIETLKGSPVSTFNNRSRRNSCSSSFKKGDLALLFVSGGRLSRCLGNRPLSRLGLRRFAERWSALASTGAADGSAVSFAVGDATRGYRHDRPRISVVVPRKTSLPRNLGLGASNLVFVHLLSGSAMPGSIIVDTALSIGSTTLIRGRYPVEGLRFAVLVTQRGRAFTVLRRWVAET